MNGDKDRTNIVILFPQWENYWQQLLEKNEKPGPSLPLFLSYPPLPLFILTYIHNCSALFV
jgi:hypothetical protein